MTLSGLGLLAIWEFLHGEVSFFVSSLLQNYFSCFIQDFWSSPSFLAFKTFISRIIFKLLLLVYKALNGKAPSYISSLLSHRKCSRSLRSSGQELLTVPLAKLKTYGDRAFSIAAPRQWNSLPLSIRKSPSIAIFKRHLKTYLFKEAYGF